MTFRYEMPAQYFIPVVLEIDYIDPLKMFTLFAGEPWAVFLDSARVMGHLGRYSFIAIDPFRTLSSKNGRIIYGDKVIYGDPFSILQEELSKHSMNPIVDLAPFQGGAAGYFAYDLCHHLEKLPGSNLDDMSFPDMAVGFYDLVIGFDQHLKRGWIISNGYPEREQGLRHARAQKRCQWLMNRLSDVPELPPLPQSVCDADQITSNFSREDYEKAVQRTIDYIYAGDIFEANISQRFSAPLPDGMTPFQLYRRLRTINAAPFAAFINAGSTVIASASPERFLRLNNDHVETRPIKGTRPRGETPEQDEALAQELRTSEKDWAENVMIVDLMRNDLSRVCRDHTINVTQLCGLESYETVHHLVSAVVGVLREGADAVDLLRATFPGGSITGAPKIRAMEIIAEIEPTSRGPYCGSIGYLGFNGEMDTSITIRTYAIKNNIVTFHAGGAIVADSDPASEYQETLDKARALQEALLRAV